MDRKITIDLSAIDAFNATFQMPSPYVLLAAIVLVTALVCIAIAMLIIQRARYANPTTRVSEHRDNWQESVHPKDLFFNLETLIMANRRYREVPNREYWPLEPDLQEETERKGNFTGRLLHETQPAYSPFERDSNENMLKINVTVTGQLLLLAMPVFLFNAPEYLRDLVVGLSQFKSLDVRTLTPTEGAEILGSSLTMILGPAMVFLYALVFQSMGRLIARAAHLSWAEMPFESMLVFLKMDGTYSESRLSTGSAIHDSTRSENLVVRSSITSWVVVSRIMSTVFAQTGRNNLEGARLIYELRPAGDDLAAILDDLQRSSLAAGPSHQSPPRPISRQRHQLLL